MVEAWHTGFALVGFLGTRGGAFESGGRDSQGAEPRHCPASPPPLPVDTHAPSPTPRAPRAARPPLRAPQPAVETLGSVNVICSDKVRGHLDLRARQ